MLFAISWCAEWLAAGWEGLGTAYLDALEKDGILLDLRKALSSDHQDQHYASAGECVTNIFGVSTSFLWTWAVCSGTVL